MRSVVLSGLALLVGLVVPSARLRAADDLRDKFGTSSVAAARALDNGIGLLKEQKSSEALTALQTAIKEDPHLQLAFYWKARAEVDLGNVDQALSTYQQMAAIAEKTQVSNVTVDGCINAGLILAKIGRDKESRLWFSRAITIDPADKFHLHWKAFRNMSISCHLRGEHASAALCAFAGYAADPQRVSAQMVLEFLQKTGKEEVGRALAFDDPVPTVAARGVETSLGDPVELHGCGATPSFLLVDPSANRVVVLGKGEAKYYLIDCGNGNEVKTVEAPGEIVAASLAGGELYLSVRPSEIVRVEPLTGRVLAKWTVPGNPPSSLAAFPALGVVLYPAGGILSVLDLETGKSAETKFSAQVVACDERQRFCFAFVREEAESSGGHFVINGRPYFIRSSHIDWIQTALYKYAICDKQPMLAELRLNAASNGRSLHVSPDGQWVAIMGGGGWRPLDHAGHGAGYGIAVFAASDLGKVQGFFATDAYPSAVAVNSVTHQVVAVRAADAKVYDLGNESDPLVLKGPHGMAAAWSPDGRYLYISGKSGLRAWPNKLSAQEETIAANWWKEVSPPKRDSKSKQEITEVHPIEAFKTFEIKSDRKDTLAAIALAEAKNCSRKPVDWMHYEPYQRDPQLREQLQPLTVRSDRSESGIRIYQLKKLRETYPLHPGIGLLLGIEYCNSGQLDKAEPELLTAIHLDQGRTDITVQSLRGLRHVRQKTGDEEAAAYCIAHVLQIDLATPRYLDEAKACFDRAKIGAPGDKLVQLGRRTALPTDLSSIERGRELPRLAIVQEEQTYSPEKIFTKAASSVVMIRAGGSVGSGVCVGENGIILTNQHVVAGNPQGIRVWAYRDHNGKLERLPPLEATVLCESDKEDLAVLRVTNPPESLVPLTVSAAPTREGAKICAIGNPGLGAGVLEHTISEGIVSSASRQLGGKAFIQHTAAVNPGNSGGPLLNDHCQVLGIITTKAELENVSFAIPAIKIRELFAAHGKAADKK